MDRKRFFDAVRNAPFPGRLTVEQVDGLGTLLDAMQAAGWPVAWAAYGLATAYHETAATMQPISERGGDAYFRRMYDIAGQRPDLARRNGNIHPGDGVKFRGRGYVQLTWRANYRRAGQKLGVDLERRPDMAMDPAIAARVLIEGMAEGWFTGKANRHYLNGPVPDYVGARRIINGTDKANLIAGHARAFERALDLAGYAPGGQPVERPQRPALPVPPPPDIPAPEPPQPARGGFWSRFLAALSRRMKG